MNDEILFDDEISDVANSTDEEFRKKTQQEYKKRIAKRRRRIRVFVVTTIILLMVGGIVGISVVYIPYIADYEVKNDAKRLARISCEMRKVNHCMLQMQSQPKEIAKLQKLYEALQREYKKLGDQIQKKFDRDQLRQKKFYDIFDKEIKKCDPEKKDCLN